MHPQAQLLSGLMNKRVIRTQLALGWNPDDGGEFIIALPPPLLQSTLVSNGTDPLKESLAPVAHSFYYPEKELINILVSRHSLRDERWILRA